MLSFAEHLLKCSQITVLIKEHVLRKSYSLSYNDEDDQTLE